ncbi:MAG: hypothetical protein U1E59_14305 [Amaricoccus sp.]|uniref:hypothetical protein n=1 Tax=Amaricoccus sp. TaxID=1872485 RepID=UPI0033147A2E
MEWFRSVGGGPRLDARLDACRAFYESNRAAAEDGLPVALFDPRDAVAWYILQAETYATDRQFWTPDESARTVPYIRRLGQLYDRLARVNGVEDRVARFVNGDPSQPDGSLYELLVAGTWAERGYEVSFIPERPGVARTPDLNATRGRSSWAVETKRMMPSAYARQEMEAGRRLAAHLHDLSEALGHSVVVDVAYRRELTHYPNEFLAECVHDLLPISSPQLFDHDDARLFVRPVAWQLCRRVLADDFVFIGSTRMMEIIGGGHNHDLSHSLRARCRRSPSRPSYADHVYHASLVNWACLSPAAHKAKAKHFNTKVADAEGQLPSDRPGVIHVGMESTGRPDADLLRHYRNGHAASLFTTGRSRLRWVYGNYFKIEATTRPNESLAMEETAVRYMISRHRTRDPLPNGLLLSDDHGVMRRGAYWD